MTEVPIFLSRMQAAWHLIISSTLSFVITGCNQLSSGVMTNLVPCHQLANKVVISVIMPNPLLSVRIPIDLEKLLPTDRGERSRTTIEALRAFLAPDPENEILSIKRRLSDVEKLLEGMRSSN